MHIPNSNLTEGKAKLDTTKLHSLYNEADILITGSPKTVTSPVGNGTRLTPVDQVRYMFPVSAPLPCPFDINQCPNGVTLSIWFRWEYFLIATRHRKFISLGSCMYLYRPNAVSSNLLSLRWVVNTKNSFFGGFIATPGQWNHIVWVVNNTHSVWYRNGLKGKTKALTNRRLSCGFGRRLTLNVALDKGTFAVGPINFWAGRRSPVFMWRIYQQGLWNDDEQWISHLVRLKTVKCISNAAKTF